MSKIAFVFPGQGAQYSGMGKDLYDNYSAARDIFDAAEAIRKGTKEQCFAADLAQLSQTINTQPCMFAVSVAHSAALNQQGVFADTVAGFSVGELAALCYAQVMDFETAFKAVIKRAELMHSAAQKHGGAMAAVLRISCDKTKELCKTAGVYAVNFNCPNQTVVAGSQEKMTEFYKLISQEGARALPLAVSGAFHSPYMDGAHKEFYDYLSCIKFNPPKLTVYSNRTAMPYTNDGNENKRFLAEQVNNPVLWQDCIENMLESGISEFIETEPGKVLTGLIAKIKTK